MLIFTWSFAVTCAEKFSIKNFSPLFTSTRFTKNRQLKLFNHNTKINPLTIEAFFRAFTLFSSSTLIFVNWGKICGNYFSINFDNFLGYFSSNFLFRFKTSIHTSLEINLSHRRTHTGLEGKSEKERNEEVVYLFFTFFTNVFIHTDESTLFFIII